MKHGEKKSRDSRNCLFASKEQRYGREGVPIVACGRRQALNLPRRGCAGVLRERLAILDIIIDAKLLFITLKNIT